MRTETQLTLTDMGHINVAVEEYYRIFSYFRQMGGDEDTKQKLNEIWDDVISKLQYHNWCDCELRVFSQTWGNTSCGWEGIGGAAMSTSKTLVIENKWTNISFVFYDGVLAYIAMMDEKWDKYRHNPSGWASCKDKLNVVWRKIKK